MTQQTLFDMPFQKEELDQWFTPPWLAKRLAEWALDSWSESVSVLEPSAGDGAVAVELARILDAGEGNRLVCCEIDPAMAARCASRVDADVINRDFLAETWCRFDLVVMNPPYSDNGELRHVLHALSISSRVVALVRLNFLSGQERRGLLWDEYSLSRMAILSARPSFGGAVDGSPIHDFVALEIVRGSVQNTEVEWW